MPPSSTGITVCLPCRLRILARYRARLASTRGVEGSCSLAFPDGSRSIAQSHIRGFRSGRSVREEHHTVDSAERIHTTWTPHRLPVGSPNLRLEAEENVEDKIATGGIQDTGEEATGITQDKEKDVLRIPEGMSPDDAAREARQYYGDRLPDGALNAEQYKIYERLYGKPLPNTSAEEALVEEEVEAREVLLKENQDGVLEEVEYVINEEPLLDEDELLEEEESGVDMEDEQAARISRNSKADDHLQRDIETAATIRESRATILSPDDPNFSDEAEEFEEDDVELDTGSQVTRTHPFTLAARSATNPRTLPLPQDSLTGPVGLLLADLNNKHVDESASRIFGGPSLPYGPGTPGPSKQMVQKPIPLSASQARMTEMEADLYMAVVMPGTYAAVMSVLVETRRRLGSQWIERLMQKAGGPRILDAGAGGAGALAWREVIKAEWERLHPTQSENPNAAPLPPPPYGKATVLTGSAPLRQRSSILLDNTTFIPRLPDYVHTSFEPDAQRKQFDIIIAPHGLWHLQEDFERKQRVLNLWSLLDADGGVLVLLEKGVPRGFEVVADARQYLLSDLFDKSAIVDSSDSNVIDPSVPPDADQEEETTPSPETKASTLRASRRHPARIIAPCTTHTKCPMYLVAGVSRQRKDYCHFQQRYVRPPYLQRILGARDRNFEDVRFSYVAVQKGVSWDGVEGGFAGGAATERAFAGYEVDDADVVPALRPTNGVPLSQALFSFPPTTPPASSPPAPSLSAPHHPLPRLILPPLKRHGHIILDACTPAGTLERWTVTKSFGKQAYRDARKSKWGDLWALGAKLRTERRVRLGWGHLEKGIGQGRGKESIAEAVAMGDKVRHGKGRGPVRDVVGRVVGEGVAGGATGSAGGEAAIRSKERRVQRRKEDEEKGRAKARRRRRDETKALFGGPLRGREE